MGYDVSIIRTAAGRRKRILPAEITALTQRYPDWYYDESSGTLERRSGNEAGFWLSASDLEITAKEPTEAQTALMIEVAQALEARVRGDNLETYRSPTETYDHPDDARLRQLTSPLGSLPSKSARISNYIKIGALVLLGLNFLAYLLHGWLSGA